MICDLCSLAGSVYFTRNALSPALHMIR